MWTGGGAGPQLTDTADVRYTPAKLVNGVAMVAFRPGTEPGRVEVEARSRTLSPGSHQIHTIPADVEVLRPTPEQLPAIVGGILAGTVYRWLGKK